MRGGGVFINSLLNPVRPSWRLILYVTLKDKFNQIKEPLSQIHVNCFNSTVPVSVCKSGNTSRGADGVSCLQASGREENKADWYQFTAQLLRQSRLILIIDSTNFWNIRNAER